MPTIIMRDRLAQMDHTPGPWEWTGGPRGMFLGTPDRGKLVVMDFVVGRSPGTVRAIPRFSYWDEGRERERLGGVMVPATEEICDLHPDAFVIAAAPDYALLLRAMLAGVARVEPLGDSVCVEICVNALRYAVRLDPAGCPRLHSLVRNELRAAIAKGPARPPCFSDTVALGSRM